ncbi:MAG TPA: CvpA family protein [Firmicutes bacterium]|nr:CvpA family protein [Bacillota bacterium]
MNIIDISLLLILSFFIVSGYNRGLVRQVFDLGGFIIALFLAAKYCSLAGSYLSGPLEFIKKYPILGGPEGVFYPYIFNIIGFLLIYLTVRLFISIFSKTIDSIAELPLISFINAAGGAFMGSIKGLVSIVAIVGILSLIPVLALEQLLEKSLLSSVVLMYFPYLIDCFRELVHIPLTV